MDALLRERLVTDNAYFKKLVGLVPANFVTDGTDNSSSAFGMAETSVRDRLHTKIEVLKGKRQKPGQAVDSVEKKRLKRKQSKANLRQRRKVEKQQSSAENKLKPKADTSVISTKPVFNKEGNVVFSKFDFAENDNVNTKHKSGTAPTGKNYKVLLDNVKKQKEKIVKIRESNPSRAQLLEDKLKWQTVMSKAEGVKVRDNPELLKKSLKKHEKKKDHSRKKWEERETKLSDQMKQRQDKRSKNLAKRKEGRKEKKIKSAKKKGRFIV